MKKLTVIIALILLMSISACSFFPDGAINNVEDKDDNNSASIYIEDNRAVGIISDNIECVSYEDINTGYSYSDHDPVYLKFRLK